jgi:hypothetical protein
MSEKEKKPWLSFCMKTIPLKRMLIDKQKINRDNVVFRGKV